MQVLQCIDNLQMWLRALYYSLGGRRLETFDLEPPQNCITGQDGLLTSHQSLEYVLDYQGFESFKG